MDLTKEIIGISLSTWETAPDWVKRVIEKEYREKNKLIHINGYSMSKPDGEIEFEVYALCFASTFTSMKVYKVYKFTVQENPYIDYVWVDCNELKTYLDAIKGVSFNEFYENDNL
jgi:hypothetical protein